MLNHFHTMFTVAVPSCRAKPLLIPAYNGLFTVVSRSQKFFILDLGECHKSVSVDRLKPHANLRSSLWPQLLAVATLLSWWLPHRRHLGVGGSVDARTIDKSPYMCVNPPKGY